MVSKGLAFENVKTFIEDVDYICLSTSYKNIKSKLSFMCPKGHIFNMSFNTYQQGHRCGECDRQKIVSKG